MKKSSSQRFGVGTIVNHPGDAAHPLHSHVMPIFQTSTFSFDTVDSALAAFSGEDRDSYVYTRGRNPNATLLAQKLAWLEGRAMMAREKTDNPGDVAAAQIYGSGMGAISAAVLSRMKSGDEALVQGSIYGGTFNLWSEICPRFGIKAHFLNSFVLDKWAAALAKNPKIKVVYIESPANPTLDIQDITALADLAHAHGAWLIVDNTFATPYHQQPLSLGADIVVHSLTKFISGHGATTGGAVVSRHPKDLELFSEFWKFSIELGSTASPMDCWITEMGLKTFEVRMQRHSENAMRVASMLQNHPKIARVDYPGLADNRYHALAARQMQNGFGGLLSFELKTGLAGSKRFMDALRIPSIAISLGSVDSLIQCPALMTHSNVPVEQREAAGITEGLIRLSVGIENFEDIRDDLEQALQEV